MYLVVSSGWIHDRFETGDEADVFIEDHIRRFPSDAGRIERVFMEVK